MQFEIRSLTDDESIVSTNEFELFQKQFEFTSEALQLHKSSAPVFRTIYSHGNIKLIATNHDNDDVTYSKTMTNNNTGDTVMLYNCLQYRHKNLQKNPKIA